MAILETGRVCLEKRGRTAGQRVVVLGMEKGKVIVAGPRVKKHAANVLHVFPTEKMVKISAGASQAEIKAALE